VSASPDDRDTDERLRDFAGPDAQPPPPPKPQRDRYFGDFRLVRKLGEGGMGVVYEAEQQHPRRPVALKVVRGGAHVSPDTVKLFQREAQTLARLRHPGIAQLYETGATEDGLHFFAMELVRGETLAEWLGKRPAGPVSPAELRLRLGLFRKICDAVAYAHQKGVIHRDLKPANVLIPNVPLGSSAPDAIPDVKVLDFGLARITDADVQASTYVTEMGRVQGTLPYMSPEQVRGNPDEIDLRTDVYGLGVILYQMVAGRLPYDLSRAQLPEAVRIICEEPPRSISATFSGTRRLDADVVTIAGKCLEKEPQRRYQSAAALGEDVGRWLADEPILARPPSAGYQLKKLVARHRGPFAFAATVFVLVTALAITSTVQALRLLAERDRANGEAEAARQVSEFLEGLFKISDPSESRGKVVTAREILDEGTRRIDRDLERLPDVQARLALVLARVHYGLGLYPEARSLVERSIPRLAPEDAAGAWALLGMMSHADGNLPRAEEEFRTAVRLSEQAFAPDSPVRVEFAYLEAQRLRLLGEQDRAEAAYRRAMELAERNARGNPLLRLWIVRDLGTLYLGMNRLADAERLCREALEIADRELPQDPERIGALNTLGFTLALRDLPDEGRSYLERAVALSEEIYGPDHPSTANIVHSLGELERRAGRLDEARGLLERALRVAEEKVGPDSTPVATVLESLAPLLVEQGRLEEAEAAYRRLLDLRQNAGQGDSGVVAESLDGLAGVLRRTGRTDEAARLETRAGELRVRHAGRMGSGFEAGLTASARLEFR
jgi:serine/threonine protein kinase/tetratricopeptide (TPR) repeat protein